MLTALTYGLRLTAWQPVFTHVPLAAELRQLAVRLVRCERQRVERAVVPAGEPHKGEEVRLDGAAGGGERGGDAEGNRGREGGREGKREGRRYSYDDVVGKPSRIWTLSLLRDKVRARTRSNGALTCQCTASTEAPQNSILGHSLVRVLGVKVAQIVQHGTQPVRI